MITSEIISQLLFWSIVIFSGVIAYEFYRSKDGRLRILIIELFLAKMWCYGVAGTYYLLWDLHHVSSDNALWLRIVCNLPMFIVMLRLYQFIRVKK